MIKPVTRQPIHLANLRKKSKVEEKVPVRMVESKNSIEYDLQIFQQSLNFHKENDFHESQDLQQRNSLLMIYSKQSIGSQINAFIKSDLMNRKEVKSISNRLQNMPINQQAISNKLISSQSIHYSNIHKAKACFKPNTSSIKNKQNNFCQLPLQNASKTRTISTICNLKSDVLKQIKMMNQNQSIIHKNDKQNKNTQEGINKVNEQKIKQLQLSNEQYQKRIIQLQTKLKQKQQMAQRVDQIQKDLNQLIEQNKELQKMNESLSKKSLCSEEVLVCDTQIQTDVFPLFVKDSFCQTLPGQLEYTVERSTENTQETDLMITVQNYKYELERQRFLSINRQIEFKAMIENTHNQHRKQMQQLQRQFQDLIINYKNKCQQVKQKEEKIAAYLASKS